MVILLLLTFYIIHFVKLISVDCLWRQCNAMFFASRWRSKPKRRFCLVFHHHMLYCSCTGEIPHLSRDACDICYFCFQLCWKMNYDLLDNDFIYVTFDSLTTITSCTCCLLTIVMFTCMGDRKETYISIRSITIFSELLI